MKVGGGGWEENEVERGGEDGGECLCPVHHESAMAVRAWEEGEGGSMVLCVLTCTMKVVQVREEG